MTATPGLQPTPQFFVPKGPLFPILCPEIRVFVRDLRDLRLLPYLCRPMKHSKAGKYPFPSPNCSGEWRSYRRILLAGTLFTLLFALLSRGFYHPDEHFQILEYAHLKLFGAETTDYLPWEYHAMMRPGLQPFIAWLLGRGLLVAGYYSPFALVSLLQLLSAAFSVVALFALFRAVYDELGTACRRRWFLYVGFFLCFEVYLHVHFTAEMATGNLLVLLVARTLRLRHSTPPSGFRAGMLLGLLAGLTFAVRYQAGFALAGYGLWLLCYHRRGRLFAGMVPGVLLALAAGVLADRWFYGEWTVVPYNYLRENILNSHMDEFGVSPWWFYFTESLREGGYLFGALMLVATGWFFIRHPKNPVTWMLVPFLFVHFLLGHKEVRFFFPALFFAPYLLLSFAQTVPQRLFAGRGWRWAVGVAAFANLCGCVYVIGTGRENTAFYRMIHAYCDGKGEVVALDCTGDWNLYSYLQLVKKRGMVDARFYMPRNFRLQHTDSPEQLERQARELAASGRQVVILSADPDFAEHTTLAVRKMEWNPYPGWVRRWFNFNGWTRFPVRNKNAYEVCAAPAPAAAP